MLLDDGYPVATCRFYELSENSVMLGRLVVLPAYRGQGLGRKTITEAERWISELGFSSVCIESRTEAVGFYERLGYKKTDDEEVFNRGTFDCITMTKEF